MALRLGIGLGNIPAAARPVPTSAPVNDVLPSITGALTQGETLTADPGAWSGLPSGAFEYQWQRSGVDIVGATSSTYVAQAADVAAGASALTVEVTATNEYLGGSSTTAESAGVTIAAPLTIGGTPPDGAVGEIYSFIPDLAGGHEPYALSYGGTYPAGLTTDPDPDEAVSGTPIASGVAEDLTITVTDADGLTAVLGPFDLTIDDESAALPAPFDRVNGPTDGPVTPKYAGFTVYSDAPIADDTEFDILRAGFDEDGNATTYTERAKITRALDKRWPIVGQEADLFASSRHIHAGDTFANGVSNNETRPAPKPGALNALTERRVFGNSGRFEITVGHMNGRQGKPVVLAVLTLNDGVNAPVSYFVTECTELTGAADRQPVYGFGITVDLSWMRSGATTAHEFTEDWKVYPWFGLAASVRDTVDGTAANKWEFATRTHRRHVDRVSAPVYVYVIPGGVDGTVNTSGAATTGGAQKVSTNAATAKANGFATPASAIQALKAATTLTGGFTDGCIVRISGVTVAISTFGVAAGTYHQSGELIIERDPDVAIGSCVVTCGATTPALRHMWLRFRNLTISRTGGTLVFGSVLTGGQLVFDGCNIDNNNVSGAFTATNVAFVDCDISNAGANSFAGSASQNAFLWRGNRLNNVANVEARHVIGSEFPNGVTALVISTARGGSNILVQGNVMKNVTTACIGTSQALDGFFFQQNLIEYISAAVSGTYMVRIAGDDDSISTDHVCLHDNTLTGAGRWGRRNGPYDETNGTPKYNTRWSVKGNIFGGSQNLKSDKFHGESDGNTEGFDTANASTFVGNWGSVYGADCEDNLMQWLTDSPEFDDAIVFGQNCLHRALDDPPATTALILETDLFTDSKSTTYNGTSATAGAGGGTYTLKPGTAATTLASDTRLPATLDGVARVVGGPIGALSVAT